MLDCTFRIGKHQIRVLDGEYICGEKPTQDAKDYARKIIDTLESIKRFAARKLRTTYNTAWRDDNDPKLDESNFCVKLGVPSIVLYDEIGFAMMFFKPRAIFDGHSVQVTIERGKPIRAILVG